MNCIWPRDLDNCPKNSGDQFIPLLVGQSGADQVGDEHLMSAPAHRLFRDCPVICLLERRLEVRRFDWVGPPDNVHQAWDLAIPDGDQMIRVRKLDHFIRRADDVDTHFPSKLGEECFGIEGRRPLEQQAKTISVYSVGATSRLVQLHRSTSFEATCTRHIRQTSQLVLMRGPNWHVMRSCSISQPQSMTDMMKGD